MKNVSKKIFLFLLLAGVFFPFFSFSYFNPGSPTGYVNDYAGMLSSNEKEALEKKLDLFEKETTHEIAVVTIKSLEGDSIENFAVNLFSDWGIGKKDKDNGVLFLIAEKERKTRIEVGYGLEGALTDAQSYWILKRVVEPAFQKGEFYRGIDEATNKIMEAVQGEEIPSLKEEPPNWLKYIFGSFFTVLIFGGWFLSLIFRMGTTKVWWPGGVWGGALALIISFAFGFFFVGIGAFVLLVPLGLALDYYLSKKFYQRFKKEGLPRWMRSGSSSGSGSSGGFGGFGGGSSGGGGASGGW